jgi:O-antigen/teichoic acid export membrane protein
VTSPDQFPEVLGGTALVLALGRLIAISARLAGTEPPGAALHIRRIAAASRWFLARALLTWALFESAPVVIFLLADEAEVAWFAAATRPVGLLTLPIFALGSLFMPVMAHDLSASRAALDARTREVNQISLAIIPFCFAGCLLGGRILLGAFGEAYHAATSTLVLTAFAYSIYLGIFSVLPLVTLGKERAVALGQVLSLLALWTAMAALVPGRGSTGAALALLVALTSSKIVHLLLYRGMSLPSGGWRSAALFAAVLGWMIAAALTPWPASVGLLLAGGAASGLVGAKKIRALILFGGPPADAARGS